jgi:hypothetical protein
MHAEVPSTDIPQRGERLLRDMPDADLSAHRGEFAAADVDTGQLFFGKTAVEALDAARQQLPHARIYVGRVGARATYEIGPSSAPRHG